MQESSPTNRESTDEHRGRRARKDWLQSNHVIIKDTVQILLLLVGTVWAFYTFVYENKIKPSLEQPEIPVTASLKEVGQRDGMIAIEADVKARNASKTRVTVIAAYYNVTGYKIDRLTELGTDAYAADIRRQLDENKTSKDTVVSRFKTPDQDEGLLVHSSNLLQNSWLDPGDEYSRDTIFYVPKDRYDLLVIKFNTIIAKNPDYLAKQWQVDNEGRIYADYFVRREDRPRVPPKPFDKLSEEEIKVILTKYGLNNYDVISGLSLWYSPSRANKDDQLNVPHDVSPESSPPHK
jgi:hypothetical protein